MLKKLYPEADENYLMLMLEGKIYTTNYINTRKKEIYDEFDKYSIMIYNVFADYLVKNNRDSFVTKDYTNIDKKLRKQISKILSEFYSWCTKHFISSIAEFYNYKLLYNLWMFETVEEEIGGEMSKTFDKKQVSSLINRKQYGYGYSDRLSNSISLCDDEVNNVIRGISTRDGATLEDVKHLINRRLRKCVAGKMANAESLGLEDIDIFAEDEAYKNIDVNSAFGGKWVRVEILDKRTCLLCAKIDGRVSNQRYGRVHPNCFPDFTMITTNNGKKQISEVTIGDIVLTHKGNMKRVVNLFKRHYTGKLIRIELENGKELFATPNHPVYVKNKDGVFEWKPIGELNIGDDIVTSCFDVVLLSKKEEINFEGLVYNFEVEDDNSYVANDIVVHNCRGIDTPITFSKDKNARLKDKLNREAKRTERFEKWFDNLPEKNKKRVLGKKKYEKYVGGKKNIHQLVKDVKVDGKKPIKSVDTSKLPKSITNNPVLVATRELKVEYNRLPKKRISNISNMDEYNAYMKYIKKKELLYRNMNIKDLRNVGILRKNLLDEVVRERKALRAVKQNKKLKT